jgi:hypothetical protein
VWSAILKKWLEEFNTLKKSLAVSHVEFLRSTLLTELVFIYQGSLGKISFTEDIWSDSWLHPYLAITAHWIQWRNDQSLELRADLIAFHYIPRSHNGKSLCDVMKHMLEGSGILHKVCQNWYMSEG